jgi:hypothetical protein
MRNVKIWHSWFLILLLLGLAPKAVFPAQAKPGWVTYKNPKFGFQFMHPAQYKLVYRFPNAKYRDSDDSLNLNLTDGEQLIKVDLETWRPDDIRKQWDFKAFARGQVTQDCLTDGDCSSHCTVENQSNAGNSQFEGLQFDLDFVVLCENDPLSRGRRPPRYAFNLSNSESKRALVFTPEIREKIISDEVMKSIVATLEPVEP